MNCKQFYREWFKRTFSGKFGKAGAVSGIVTVILIPIAAYWKPKEGVIDWIVVGVFAAVFFGTAGRGFLLAPFSIYKGSEDENAELKTERDSLKERMLPRFMISTGKTHPYESHDLPHGIKVLWRIGIENIGLDTIDDVTVELVDMLPAGTNNVIPATLHQMGDNPIKQDEPYKTSFDLPHGPPKMIDVIGIRVGSKFTEDPEKPWRGSTEGMDEWFLYYADKLLPAILPLIDEEYHLKIVVRGRNVSSVERWFTAKVENSQYLFMAKDLDKS